MTGVEYFFRNMLIDLQYLPTIIQTEIISAKRKSREAAEESKVTEKAEDSEKKEEKSETVQDVKEDQKEEKKEKDVANIVKKSLATNKFVYYTIWYMTNKGAELMKLSDEEMELVNGIAAVFDYGKIYESAEVADLKKYDPESEEFDSSVNYVVSIKDLESKNTEEIQLKIQAAKNNDEPIDVEYMDKDEDALSVEHPIEFTVTPDSEVPKTSYKEPKIDENLSMMLDETISEYIGDTNHRWEAARENGLFNLYIEDKDSPVERMITVDPFGRLMGGKIPYIMAKIPNDTIMVPINADKKFVKSIFRNPFKLLTEDEYKKIGARFFNNAHIYRFIDMSDTDFLFGMKKKEKKKLEDNLTNLVNAAYKYNVKLPRLRFEEFKSSEDFTLISDEKCVSPLSGTGETIMEIAKGLRYIFKDGKIVQTLNGVEVEIAA